MCEFWKWIAIGTFVPLLLFRLYVYPPFVWMLRRERTEAIERKVVPYARFWWLGVFVMIFALVIYVIHCAN